MRTSNRVKTYRVFFKGWGKNVATGENVAAEIATVWIKYKDMKISKQYSTVSCFVRWDDTRN